MRNIRTAAILTGAIGGALLMAGQAVADPITVDGIQFESGSVLATSQLFENAVSGQGDVLSGYGKINTIGTGVNNDQYCAGGGNCELTFTFGDYVVDSVGASQATFTGGTVTFFADSSADFDPSDMSTATDGDTFLTTVGHTFMDSGTGRTGTLLAQGANLDTSNAQGTGVGQLDVTGGDAAAFFDTNAQNDFIDNGMNSDILFNSSFSPCPDGTPTDLCGSADVHAVAQSVPEPGALGLMGLGLLGVGFAARRRRRR